MLNNSEYIRVSLELHLFFIRIMKEHSLFLLASFTDKDAEYKNAAADFEKTFNEILNRVVNLANNNISNEIIKSQEIVTNDTLESEIKTSTLLGVSIDENVTRQEMQLASGNVEENQQLLDEINSINQQVLPLVNNLIEFKRDILDQVIDCKMYTSNYPLFIAHMMNEAIVYYNTLSKVQGKGEFDENHMYGQEIFWDNIMKEHAQFIRGLLDPSENDMILTADRFANEYRQILTAYQLTQINLTAVSLEETTNFQAFNRFNEEGILNCQIKSTIMPLLADHLLREANHFIRVLGDYQNLTQNNS